jgi:uncharacterized damage-inducible protein DinB
MENTLMDSNTSLIPAEVLLDHWQGHRRVTRRVIEAFPEHELFNFSIGGMRPFAQMAMEFIGMASPGIHGVLTGEWRMVEELDYHQGAGLPKTKKELLQRWDEVTEKIDRLWPQVPPERFRELDIAFGQYEGPVYSFIQYWIDNEIHHRGQGYVYLRALGIEPPAFYDRS